eukprot:4582824-Pyramimonas_sp.AAC.1
MSHAVSSSMGRRGPEALCAVEAVRQWFRTRQRINANPDREGDVLAGATLGMLDFSARILRIASDRASSSLMGCLLDSDEIPVRGRRTFSLRPYLRLRSCPCTG